MVLDRDVWENGNWKWFWSRRDEAFFRIQGEKSFGGEDEGAGDLRGWFEGTEEGSSIRDDCSLLQRGIVLLPDDSVSPKNAESSP